MQDTTGESRLVYLALALLAAGGLLVWFFYALWLDPPSAMRALLINFMLFTPISAGMVVWSPVVRLSNGNWMGATERLALSGIAQMPVSLIVFLTLALTCGLWAPWTREHVHQGLWLSPVSVFVRDGAGLIALWLLAAVYVRRRADGRRSPRLAAVLTLSYCLVITLLAFDLVMALDPHWYSTLFGWYTFITGMFGAVAVWALAATLSPKADADQLHDLGKLIVAFSLLSAYMMYAQLLAIWYENLPHEVRFVVPRLWISDWRALSVALLSVVYLGPLVLLLPRQVKRTRWSLGLVSALVVLGLWVERWWLIAPTSHEGPASTPTLRFGWELISITVCIGSLFVLGLLVVNKRLAARMDAEANHEPA